MGLRDERVDAYIAAAAPFAPPLLEHLRSVVHEACPECGETIRWGAPSFSYRGRVLCGMAAFKQHAVFWLWRAAAAPAAGKAGEAMGQFGRLTQRSDLPGKQVLRAAIRQGMRRIEEGAPGSPVKKARPAPRVPVELAAALEANALARRHFDGFPPGARRDYAEWITEAKREDTRRRRAAQAVEWLAEGKRRHWKYERR